MKKQKLKNKRMEINTRINRQADGFLFQTLTVPRSNIIMSFTVLSNHALTERYVLFGGTNEIFK